MRLMQMALALDPAIAQRWGHGTGGPAVSRQSRQARRRLQEISQLMESERHEALSIRLRRITRAIDNRPDGPSRVEGHNHVEVDLQGRAPAAKHEAQAERS